MLPCQKSTSVRWDKTSALTTASWTCEPSPTRLFSRFRFEAPAVLASLAWSHPTSLQSGVGALFREFLLGQGFTEIHSPKILGAASESGARSVLPPRLSHHATLPARVFAASLSSSTLETPRSWHSRRSSTSKWLLLLTLKRCLKSDRCSEPKTPTRTDTCASLRAWTSKWPSTNTITRCAAAHS